MVHGQKWKDRWIKPDLTTKTKGSLVITDWGWAVQHPENLHLGNFVDIGYGSYINAEFGVVIEDDVEIGGGCHIYSKDSIDDKVGLVKLKTGCMIGAHTVILPGVTVGENAVVGACSLLKRDVAPNTMVCGVPTKSYTRKQ